MQVYQYEQHLNMLGEVERRKKEARHVDGVRLLALAASQQAVAVAETDSTVYAVCCKGFIQHLGSQCENCGAEVQAVSPGEAEDYGAAAEAEDTEDARADSSTGTGAGGLVIRKSVRQQLNVVAAAGANYSCTLFGDGGCLLANAR